MWISDSLGTSWWFFFNQLLEMLISNRSWLIDFALLFLVEIFIKSEGFFFTQIKKTFYTLDEKLTEWARDSPSWFLH